MPEVVLTEFPRHALEAHQRRDTRGPHSPHQFVDGTLAPTVAVLLAEPAQDLEAGQGALLAQLGRHLLRPAGRDRRPPDVPRLDQRGGLAGRHRDLALDPPDAPDRRIGPRTDGSVAHLCCAQSLDLMPGHGVDHPSPFPGAASWHGAPGKSLRSLPETGHIFRNGRGQNFRNPRALGVPRTYLLRLIRQLSISNAQPVQATPPVAEPR